MIFFCEASKETIFVTGIATEMFNSNNLTRKASPFLQIFTNFTDFCFLRYL